MKFQKVKQTKSYRRDREGKVVRIVAVKPDRNINDYQTEEAKEG